MLPPAEPFLRFAEQLADRARETTLHYFRQPLTIDSKADASPVTIADRQTEATLREMISARYPDHAILGEEHGISGDSDWQWILDPIDGTKSFISGFPIYCTLIALLYQGRPILCLIDMPVLKERFIATAEGDSQLNGQPIHTRQTSELTHAICYSTDPIMFSHTQQNRLEPLRQQLAMQRFTGDGYLYGMLAAGWIDLVIEADMKPYDFLPLVLVVERAGGVITDWEGQPLTLASDGNILAAATPALHQAALRQLQISL